MARSVAISLVGSFFRVAGGCAAGCAALGCRSACADCKPLPGSRVHICDPSHAGTVPAAKSAATSALTRAEFRAFLSDVRFAASLCHMSNSAESRV